MDSATRCRRGRHCRSSRHRTNAVGRQFNTTGHSARHGGAPHCDGDTPAPIDSRADSQPLERRNRNTNPRSRRGSVRTHTKANARCSEGRLTHTSANACGYEGQHALSYAHTCGVGGQHAHPGANSCGGGDGRAHSDANVRSGGDGRAHSDANGCGSRSVRRWHLPRAFRDRAGNVPRPRLRQLVPRLPRQHLPRGIRPRTSCLRGTGRVVQHPRQGLHDLRTPSSMRSAAPASGRG